MGLFKSKDDRRIEREMSIKQGMAKMRQHMTMLKKSEDEWLVKAREARRMQAPEMVEMIRRQLKQVVGQRRHIERQLLMLEVAKQVKDQAEANVAFVQALSQVSAAIGDSYAGIKIEDTQANFERAMSQAQSMSQRLDFMFDMSKDSMFSADTTATGETLITDDEIEQMIGGPVAKTRAGREKADLDREVEAELRGIADDEAQEKERDRT
jgi:hypothetical protein